MTEKIHNTPCGKIHYWINKTAHNSTPQLVFLPGLTADHRLFDKQIEYFKSKYPIFVWDAPAHGASWPFDFNFNLTNKVHWLNEILQKEDFNKPIIIGQSMGAYVGQVYSEFYPNQLHGFISIDSAPLQREYTTAFEIWLLKRMEPIYRLCPWKMLLSSGSKGVSTTEYGRQLMLDMMTTYNTDKERYTRLSGHGMKILGEAIDANLPYQINCPALLICGEKDHAGSSIRHNKAWHKNTGIPLVWIPNTGHNSNTDAPTLVNQLIDDFIKNYN